MTTYSIRLLNGALVTFKAWLRLRFLAMITLAKITKTLAEYPKKPMSLDLKGIGFVDIDAKAKATSLPDGSGEIQFNVHTEQRQGSKEKFAFTFAIYHCK